MVRAYDLHSSAADYVCASHPNRLATVALALPSIDPASQVSIVFMLRGYQCSEGERIFLEAPAKADWGRK
ncbi:hypothetical protein TWF225_000151 [Orbilia oligospora]|uniref:Uncharacterized protein n=1 Tax=Orbilia oligospora TaxID=2813651 RepID=A0A7C8U9H4_ORBOL|nr:hypothetical protein TWF751_004181 [Orbilia oligospora]KAF3195766.1 hypothetical protein TWF225_000151 [Orbilia oligospora]KAF3235139.1 hypothetical protein TWF128_002131 [Orbilia oligospora]KAF3259922.1 hypothetical protein TWF217_004956 [Orbilia oligospora]KAF3297513.1 hypothetical protein TWF132_005942 [Orbilia oligospora]